MDAKNITYTITQLTRHFGITPRTVRYYEDKGLLSPLRAGNQRIYQERDFIRLKLILRGRRIGFSLAELERTMNLYDSEAGESRQIEYVLAVIEKHRIELQLRKKDIVDTLKDMRDIEARLRAAK